MKVGTGIQQTDESIIQPGHLESARQEALHATSDGQAPPPHRPPPHARSSTSPPISHPHGPLRGNSGLSMPSGIGSVEAWRAHAAGVYGQPSNHHATGLTQAALLRANGGGGGVATDSAPGSDINIEVPGSFRGSVAGAGIGLASSVASSSIPNGLRSRPGFIQ